MKNKIIGIFLISLPFVALFIYTVYREGWAITGLIWGGIAATIAVIWGGVELAMSDQ